MRETVKWAFGKSRPQAVVLFVQVDAVMRNDASIICLRVVWQPVTAPESQGLNVDKQLLGYHADTAYFVPEQIIHCG